MHAGSVLRGLRAGVFAAACVLLAAPGHVMMSQAPVPPLTLLLAWTGAATGAWCLAGRERGPLAVGLLTVGTQAFAHCAFSLGQPAAGHHAAHAMPHDGPPGAGTGMTAAHGLVALLSAWWLWGGERAVFRLLRAASARLFRPPVRPPAGTPPAPPPAVRGRPERRLRLPRQVLLSHVIWLRGPPAVSAVR